MSDWSSLNLRNPKVVDNFEGSVKQRFIHEIGRAILIITICLTHLSCDSGNHQQDHVVKYFDTLEQLIRHEAVQVTRGQIDLSQLSANEDRPRLVTKKLRRYQIPAPPTMNVRDFMKIANCSIAQQIAFRNSPLGRVMLPSQDWAYQYRFLQAAKSCQVQEGTLKKQLDMVIEHKQRYWSQYQWNGIWAGNTLAKFFSTSWPRNYKIRNLSAEDEVRFSWLGRLRPTMEIQFSVELEYNLSNIPEYVGGQILENAHHILGFLQKNAARLKGVKLNMNELSQTAKQKFCELFQATLSSFGRLQAQTSQSYQHLAKLQKSIQPILGSDSAYSSSKMKAFVNRWLSDQTQDSVIIQLKQLSKENVNLWLSLQKQTRCS